MPSLRIAIPGQPPSHYALYKNLTTLGRGPQNDLVIDHPSVGKTHAHIHFDGRDFTLSCLDAESRLVQEGKLRRKHRLAHEDRVAIGDVTLDFSIYDAPSLDEPPSQALARLKEYRQLYELSLDLLAKDDVSELLEKVMDTVISVTSADKGFLLLKEHDSLLVRVARNVQRENVSDAVAQLSDSVLEKVVRTGKALIVSDALHDAEFANARSVIHLQLSSVMCVPMTASGGLLGVIYVGSSHVTRLFEPHHLEMLTIFAAQAALILRNALLVESLRHDKQALTQRLEQARFGELIGACTSMQDIFRKIERVALTDVSVLVTGETGTGKELVAREIHERSPRRTGPFVTINCGAIPENLLESELFGHVRGAFTGAVSTKMGRFQAAAGGTLFLDEIGEMALALQVKILRALQEKSIVKVGDTREEPVDIRIVAATNKDLEAELRAGRFREDLYYRVAVVQLHLPPLRERGDDIVLIARYLLGRLAREHDQRAHGLSPRAPSALLRHAWPGNVRELENRLRKGIVLAESSLLEPEDLGLETSGPRPILPLAEAREQWQREYIHRVLELNGGNRTKAAHDLGVDPRTIFRHLERE